MPGMAASFGRSSSITCSGEFRRISRGFSRTKTRPVLPAAFGPPAPTLEENASTFGSLRSTSATARWRRTMASYETSWAASVTPKIMPGVLVGDEAFGYLHEQVHGGHQ